MNKQFTLLQLFSIADGRLSTKMEDVYEMLDHICDTQLMTHHLPVANRYIMSKNPDWLNKIKEDLIIIGAGKDQEFKTCINKINESNAIYDIPQLKDDFNTDDFGTYMVENSLLLKMGSKQ